MQSFDLSALRPYIDQEMTEAYQKALEKIIAGEDSDLLELWKEAGQHEEWISIQQDLLRRIS